MRIGVPTEIKSDEFQVGLVFAVCVNWRRADTK